MTCSERVVPREEILTEAMGLVYTGQRDRAFWLVVHRLGGTSYLKPELELKLRQYGVATSKKDPKVAEDWLSKFIHAETHLCRKDL